MPRGGQWLIHNGTRKTGIQIMMIKKMMMTSTAVIMMIIAVVVKVRRDIIRVIMMGF